MIIYVLSCLVFIASIFILIYLSTKKMRTIVDGEQILKINSNEMKTKEKSRKKSGIVSISMDEFKKNKKNLFENYTNLEVVDLVKKKTKKKSVKRSSPINTPIVETTEIDDSVNIILDNKHENNLVLEDLFEEQKTIFNTRFSEIKHCVITQYHADNTSAYSRQIVSEEDFLEVLSKLKRYSSNVVSGYRFSIVYDGIEEVFNLTTTIS